jgi:crotonobetainyl-CoA:carnitine CoA-transferase CaiB-like acyl-CoA transferase
MKLDGITVLDLSLFLPGPAATQLMADHGARVIKVENPRAPEPTRSAQAFPWTQGGETVMFRNTQRGKESIALNLKTAAGKKALLALAKQVDVVVEAFRPGVAERLGIDYQTLSAENPGLVYCSISAFGQTGPWRDRPAHDTATVAAAGILDVTRSPEGEGGPAIIAVPIADMLSSYLALSGILMALHRRQTTGGGDFVDISMFESVLAASPNILGPVFGGNQAPERLRERSHGGNAMLNIYETADGQFIALGGGEHKFVEALFTACEPRSAREPSPIGTPGLRGATSAGAPWPHSKTHGMPTMCGREACAFEMPTAMTILARRFDFRENRLKSRRNCPPSAPKLPKLSLNWT